MQKDQTKDEMLYQLYNKLLDSGKIIEEEKAEMKRLTEMLFNDPGIPSELEESLLIIMQLTEKAGKELDKIRDQTKSEKLELVKIKKHVKMSKVNLGIHIGIEIIMIITAFATSLF